MSAWKRYWTWHGRHSFMIGILIWTYLLISFSENFVTESDGYTWIWAVGVVAALACLTQQAWDAIKGRENR